MENPVVLALTYALPLVGLLGLSLVRWAGRRWSATTLLVGMVLAEQDDEWQDGRRYFRPETMAAIDAVHVEEVTPLLLAS